MLLYFCRIQFSTTDRCVLCVTCSLVIDVVGVEDYTTNVKAQTEAGLINVDLGEGNYYYGYGYGR